MNGNNFLIAFSIGCLWPWNSSPNRDCLLNYINNLDLEGIELTFATREQLLSFDLSAQNRMWLESLDVGHAYMSSKNEVRLIVDEFRNRIKQVHFHAAYRGKDHLQFDNPSKSYIKAIQPVFDLDCTIVIEENFFEIDMDPVKREILNVKTMFRGKADENGLSQ